MASLIEVRNKIDLIDPAQRGALVNQAARDGNAVIVSGTTGEGCDALLEAIDDRLNAERCVLDLSIDLSDGAAIAWLYRRGEVLSRQDDENLAHIRVGLDAADAARFEHRFTSRVPAH